MTWLSWPAALATITAGLIFAGPAVTQETPPQPAQTLDAIPSVEEEEVVEYPAGFFERYQPNTALEMVRQLPGFQLDDGLELRGFGGAAGNILINDRRPSAKQDPPSQILARIPASNVERIELIRGQLRGIDLRGQSVVANIHLREDTPATTRFEATITENLRHGLIPAGSISLAHRWREIEYNLGLDARYSNAGDSGPEDVFDSDGDLIEERFNDDTTPGMDGGDMNAYLNASTWLGDTFVTLNSKAAFHARDDLAILYRYPLTPGSETSTEYIQDERRDIEFELGFDGERLLHQDLLGKAIFLFSRLDQYPADAQRNFNAAGNRTLFRVADTNALATETIGRLEFDWAGWANHAVQANVEVAYNLLDNELLQTVDTGGGPVEVDVPGSDVRVEETRGDLLLQDTLALGQAWVLDYGLGFEVSELSQTGDANQERTFSFIKPQALLSWSPEQNRQTRLRMAREVAQLDFNDFVSATVFQDDDLALGNPDLKPESTWVAEISYERRFGELGVVTLTAFHHWVKDAQDLLPITSEFEAPGNIGDGRRMGVELESTLPLEWTGLAGARLDIRTRLQDSTVTDPVTGEERDFSAEAGFGGPPEIPFLNENDYVYDITFRQDLNAAQVAWGWQVANQAERPKFKVNELDIIDEGTEVNVFIETTRWWDLKLSLEGSNILDFDETRNRTIYVGERGLSPVLVRELENRHNGARISLTVSGSF